MGHDTDHVSRRLAGLPPRAVVPRDKLFGHDHPRAPGKGEMEVAGAFWDHMQLTNTRYHPTLLRHPVRPLLGASHWAVVVGVLAVAAFMVV